MSADGPARARGRGAGQGAILGLWDGHDSGVALAADGALVFALSEERPTRRKRCSGFPWRAVQAALVEAERRGLTITDVAIAGRGGRAPLRLLDRFYASGSPSRDPLSLGSALVRGWENRAPSLPWLSALDTVVSERALAARLRASGLDGARTHFIAHHAAHAASASLGATDEPALVVTWDAYGEGTALSARSLDASGALAGGRDGDRHDHLLLEREPRVGLARVYGAVTVRLGFEEGEEGKVMGLAASGDPHVALDRFRALFALDEDGVPRLRARLTRARVDALVADLSVEDTSAALQAVTEEVARRAVAGLLRRAGAPRRLLVAGGLFANVRLNQSLAELPGVAGFFAFPHMSDGGLAAGAAEWVHRRATGRSLAALEDAFLGREFDAASLAAAARSTGLRARRVANPAAALAAHLGAGRVVCLYTSRDELGPRALGNRSILFPAIDRALCDRVNAALRRDGFMPFAPVLRASDAAACLRSPLAARDLRWMTVTAEATEELARRCPAAVHVDGTVRPQLVDERTHPILHRALTLYRAAGGPPAVINTSFNLHREPIVHTPDDAARTFVASGLDVLLLGDHEILSPATAAVG